jgi:beta-galactosidase
MRRLILFFGLCGFLTAAFCQGLPIAERIGRGECKVEGGVLTAKDAYACYGDTSWRDYEIRFRAMAHDHDIRGTQPGDLRLAGEVHICAGFRARNRDDRYILGLKGGSFNALYLERMGYMGTDDYLALRPLAFPVRPGEWYRFRVVVAGNRIRVFLNDEALPRIDVRDPNAALCPNGRVTLGGSYLETSYEGLTVQPVKENALEGPVREWTMPAPDKERQRQTERAAYRPLTLAALAGSRTVLSLDGDWLFCPGYALGRPAEAIEVSKDDHSWHVLHVPDFWNPSRVWLHGEKYKSESKGASDKYYQQEILRCANYSFDYTRTDVGWYRQWIELPASVQGKHMILSFDAVSKVAEVWVNGQKTGSHIGMFGDFSLDVSAMLHPGKNLVTVKVLRNYINDIRDADKITDVAVTVEVTQRMIKDLAHGFFVDDPAGIWQPVKLTITDPLHITDVFVKPGLSGASFEVTVRNDGSSDRIFSLRTSISGISAAGGSAGEPVAGGTVGTLYTGVSASAVRLKAGEERVLQYTVEGLKPRLWSPERPNLYAFRFAITDASAGDNDGSAVGGVVDSLTVRSGFRTFEVRDGFFYLNGRRYWLRGANQTAMPLAPNDARLAYRFCELLHDAHINATRTHTVPFTETWLDAADAKGLGVSYEGTWPWLMLQSSMPDSALIDLWRQEWLDLLKKYRNHPSLLLWTVNNEMKFYDNDPDIERAKTKMQIISAVVRQMRKIDPTRPMVFDSNYHRNKKRFGADFLAAIDDGDVDDIHMYPNWYDNSIFDQFKGEFQAKYKNEGRPLISQEMSTGYSNNETGHPVRFYTFVHQTAQALVGRYAYDYSDPAYFLHTHAFITKELAEAFRRTDDQATGILHFASITWFRYVYSADSIQPYPIYYSMEQALQPLLVSAELWGRHFYGGTRLPVRVCIVNDQDDTVLDRPAVLHWEFQGAAGAVLASGTMPVDTVGYYGRRWLSPAIDVPVLSGREDAKLVLRLMRGERVLSTNDYPVVIASRSWVADKTPALRLVDHSGWLAGWLDTLGVKYTRYATVDEALTPAPEAAAGAVSVSAGGAVPVVLAGLNPGNASLDELGKIKTYVQGGGKVLWLNPGTMATVVYPEYIKGVLDSKGEIMNMDIPESAVFDGLEPMDLRYFNNNQREPPTVCAGAFRITRGAELTAPVSFTRVHGYLSGDVAQRVAALEKLRGFPILRIGDKGTLFLSQVSLDKAVTDPVAGRLFTNLLKSLAYDLP